MPIGYDNEVVITGHGSSPYLSLKVNLNTDLFLDYEDFKGSIKHYTYLHIFYMRGQQEYRDRVMFISIEDMPSFIKYLDDYINNTITNPIFTWPVPFRYYPLHTRMDKFEVTTSPDSFKMTITPGVDICGNKATVAVNFAFSEKESVIKFRNFCLDIITDYDRHADADSHRLHKAELAEIEKDSISNHRWDIIPHDKIVYISSTNEDLT